MKVRWVFLLMVALVSFSSCATYSSFNEWKSERLLRRVERRTIKVNAFALQHPERKKAIIRKTKRVQLMVSRYNNIPVRDEGFSIFQP
jgi:hypothetical protein